MFHKFFTIFISVGNLDKDDFESHHGNGEWKLTKENLVIARKHKEGYLYIIFFETFAHDIHIYTGLGKKNPE